MLHSFLIHLQKAFDFVSLNDVIPLLYKKQMPSDTRKTMENTCKEHKTQARIDNKSTKEIGSHYYGQNYIKGETSERL